VKVLIFGSCGFQTNTNKNRIKYSWGVNFLQLILSQNPEIENLGLGAPYLVIPQ